MIADPQKSLHEIITSDNESNGHYLELQRMQAALKTYLDTDASLRYVALVGSFSSGKTATINNPIEIAGTEQARAEDTNPADDKLTLCAHESKEQSLLATLVKSTWEADRFFHHVNDLADVILVDTPGEGDPRIRTDIVHNFLPICDTIVYCFNATNPLNRNDLPILQELNEVLLHTDFFYIYTRADNVYRKSEQKPFSSENFDQRRAKRDKEVFISRLNAALSHLPARSPELLFIGNRDNFGIDQLKTRILTPPGDVTSLALQKLAFFRVRSIASLDGILKLLNELSMTVRELVRRAEENHREYNTKFEIRTEEIKEFWRSAQSILRETLGRYKELETNKIVFPVDADALEHEFFEKSKSTEEVERLAANTLQSLTIEIGRAAKQEFEGWREDIRDRIRSRSLACIGDGQIKQELAKSLKTSLSLAEDKRSFFEQARDRIGALSTAASQSAVNHLKTRCKDHKADFDKAFRHSELGELFVVEKQLNEQCTKQIGSAIEHFASLIDVYVTWINTAGNMLLIERAHLAKDIDFLQSEKIGDQQKIVVTRNLISDIFRADRLSLAEIERKCGFFPDELKKWSSECDALSKQVDDLGFDILHSRLLPDLATLSPIWDEAIHPMVARYEISQEEQREKVISFLAKKYDDALTEFEFNKTQVMAAWKKRIKIVGGIGAALITLGALAYYKLSVDQSGTEAIVIGACGNALWGFLCAIYQKIRSDDKAWIVKSKRGTFESATPKALDELRRIELVAPLDLVEVQDQCRARLAAALTQLVVARAKQIRTLLHSLVTEINTVRRSGRDTVEAYRAEWEKARGIIEKLYQESDDKADKFKLVATAFKERTMDRTRQLFGDRGAELEGYRNQLLEFVTAMREIH